MRGVAAAVDCTIFSQHQQQPTLRPIFGRKFCHKLPSVIALLYIQSFKHARGLGHFERKFYVEGVVAHQPLLVSEIYSDCPFIWYQQVRSRFFRFVAKHGCDGRTDRQNYDSYIALACVARYKIVDVRV